MNKRIWVVLDRQPLSVRFLPETRSVPSYVPCAIRRQYIVRLLDTYFLITYQWQIRSFEYILNEHWSE